MHLEVLRIGKAKAFAKRLTPPPMESEPDRLNSLEKHLATKSEVVPMLPPSEMPSTFVLGMPLNWNSPYIGIDLYVELPL